ncbi:hypothetical protein JTE90_018731, partial [Oedothorax gibbosus]
SPQPAAEGGGGARVPPSHRLLPAAAARVARAVLRLRLPERGAEARALRRARAERGAAQDLVPEPARQDQEGGGGRPRTPAEGERPLRPLHLVVTPGLLLVTLVLNRLGIAVLKMHSVRDNRIHVAPRRRSFRRCASS